MPVSAGIVRSYVPGETTDTAVLATAALVDDGLRTTLDFLGEDTLDVEQADATVTAYTELLRGLALKGLTGHAEVSVKLSAIGQALRSDTGEATRSRSRTPAPSAARPATPAPRSPSTWRTTPPPTRRWRSCATCARTSPRPARCCSPTSTAPRPTAARSPTRGRGCGCARAPTTSRTTWRSRTGSRSTSPTCAASRCCWPAQGYPMIATHDPRMIEIASSLSSRYGRAQGTYEFQMLYGIRPEEQKRLAAGGETVRVYLPYGTRVVRLPHAQARRAPAEPVLLPEVPDLQEVTIRSWRSSATPRASPRSAPRGAAGRCRP